MSELARVKPYIKYAALVVLGGTLLGILGMLLFPDAVTAAFRTVFSVIEDLGRKILQEQTAARGTVTLFIHNMRAVVLMTLLGLVLGIYPIIGMLVNGAMLGVVFGSAFAGNIPLLTVVAGILPHGIIEIPALVLGAGAGLYLGWAPFNKRVWPGYREGLIDALKILVLCALMLAVAAVIEVNITPHLIRLVS